MNGSCRASDLRQAFGVNVIAPLRGAPALLVEVIGRVGLTLRRYVMRVFVLLSNSDIGLTLRKGRREGGKSPEFRGGLLCHFEATRR